MPAHAPPAAQAWALIGPPGAGKSSVGRALARLLQCDVLDLDLAIERGAGCSIAELFARAGEAGFRAQESLCMRSCLSHPRPFVLACGGGTWVQPSLRMQLIATCHVVCLTATPEVLMARIRADASGAPRPLLQGDDPDTALRALLARRASIYAACAHQVDTTHLDVAATARATLATWAPKTRQPGTG